jgi:hypothetical protein
LGHLLTPVDSLDEAIGTDPSARQVLATWRADPLFRDDASPRCVVSELSCSLQAGRAPRLRILAETLPADTSTVDFERPEGDSGIADLDSTEVAANRDEEMLRQRTALGNLGRTTIRAALGLSEEVALRFTSLFEPLARDAIRKPSSRFGISYDPGTPASPPSFRWYVAPSIDLVRTISAEFVGPHGAEPLEALIAEPALTYRGTGFELFADGSVGAKVYFAVPACDWDWLSQWSTLVGVLPRGEALEVFHATVLHGKSRFVQNTVLLALACHPAVRPAIKYDFFLPQLYGSDIAATGAMRDYCDLNHIDCRVYEGAFDALSGGQTTASVNHYVSLDVDQTGNPKLNIYLRPVSGPHANVPVRFRPHVLGGNDSSQSVQVIQHALVFLKQLRERQFQDLHHAMVFPQAAGFQGTTAQVGDVFARAYLLYTLALLRGAYDIDAADIDLDVQHLRTRADPHSGLWKYFPDLPALPADVDDCAQVLLALAAADPRLVEPIGGKALATLDAGLVSTWLIVETDPNAGLQHQMIEHAWGRGLESEVAANIAFALHRVDSERYRTVIDRVADRLAQCQEPDGSWLSTWYVGSAYGTWLAVRLLAECRPSSESLSRAACWLSATAEPSGSLDLALEALTADALIRAGVATEAGRLKEHFLTELSKRQDRDGGWAAESLIQMDVSRAAVQHGLGDSRMLYHGSRGLTTCLAVLALLTAPCSVGAPRRVDRVSS